VLDGIGILWVSTVFIVDDGVERDGQGRRA